MVVVPRRGTVTPAPRRTRKAPISEASFSAGGVRRRRLREDTCNAAAINFEPAAYKIAGVSTECRSAVTEGSSLQVGVISRLDQNSSVKFDFTESTTGMTTRGG